MKIPSYTSSSAVAIAYVLTLLLALGITHITRYQLHDADSKLYAAIAANMAQTPLDRWCAPTWSGNWQRQGWFIEHPPGLLWMGAALIKLGMQPLQAMYSINFCCFFISLGLLWRLGKKLGDHDLGLCAVCLWAISPAFLQYLVRGSQEHPLALACLIASNVLIGNGAQPLTTICGFSVALCLALFVKGLPALALLVVAGCYVAYYQRTWRLLLSLFVATLISICCCVLFDRWYVHTTGASFWYAYMQQQVLYSLQYHTAGSHVALQKLYNLVYYFMRPWWYGGIAVWLILFAIIKQPKLRVIKSLPSALGLCWSLVFIIGFSCANRKACRYLFPIYPGLALSAAYLLPRCKAVVARYRNIMPYVLMLWIILAITLKIYIGTYHYTFIRLFPGT